MTDPSPTQLLLCIQAGDRSGVNRLFELVYGELRREAHRTLRDNTMANQLSSTELVHDAYLKLIRSDDIDWQGRTHFFRIGAKAMRQILVDRARAKEASKRGGDFNRLTLDSESLSRSDDRHVLAVDQTLEALEEIDPMQAKIVELRFFGGMSVAEVAKHLGKSKRWVEAEWTMIRAWLRAELDEKGGDETKR